MNRDEYREEYLQSEHWRVTRAGALTHADNRCQVCNSPKRLDVHHRTYERLGKELPADLTVLCRGCHDLYHAAKRGTTPAPSKPVKPRDILGVVYVLERIGPATAQQIASELGARSSRVSGELGMLKKRKVVQKNGKRWHLPGQALPPLPEKIKKVPQDQSHLHPKFRGAVRL